MANLAWIHHLYHGTRNIFKQLLNHGLVSPCLDFPVLLLHLCSFATGSFMGSQPIEQAAFSWVNSSYVPWNSPPALPLSLYHGCTHGLVSFPFSGSISFSSWLGSLDGPQTWFTPSCVCHCSLTLSPACAGTEPVCWGHSWLSAPCPWGKDLRPCCSLTAEIFSKLQILLHPLLSVAGMFEPWSEQGWPKWPLGDLGI